MTYPIVFYLDPLLLTGLDVLTIRLRLTAWCARVNEVLTRSDAQSRVIYGNWKTWTPGQNFWSNTGGLLPRRDYEIWLAITKGDQSQGGSATHDRSYGAIVIQMMNWGAIHDAADPTPNHDLDVQISTFLHDALWHGKGCTFEPKYFNIVRDTSGEEPILSPISRADRVYWQEEDAYDPCHGFIPLADMKLSPLSVAVADGEWRLSDFPVPLPDWKHCVVLAPPGTPVKVWEVVCNGSDGEHSWIIQDLATDIEGMAFWNFQPEGELFNYDRFARKVKVGNQARWVTTWDLLKASLLQNVSTFVMDFNAPVEPSKEQSVLFFLDAMQHLAGDVEKLVTQLGQKPEILRQMAAKLKALLEP